MSDDGPHSKYKASNNTYFKFLKDYLLKNGQPIQKDPYFQNKKLAKNNNYIVFKFSFFRKSINCLVTIFDNLSMDISCSSGKNRVSRDVVLQEMFECINKNLIEKIRREFPSVDFIDNISLDTINMSQLVANGTLGMLPDNGAKHEYLVKALDRFDTFFKVVDQKNDNIIQLRYKKVDNFNKISKIQQFVLKNANESKGDIIQKIAREFSLTITEAELEYEKYFRDENIDDGKFRAIHNFDHVDIFFSKQSRYSSNVKYAIKMNVIKTLKTLDNIHARIKELFLFAAGLTNKREDDEDDIIIPIIDDKDEDDDLPNDQEIPDLSLDEMIRMLNEQQGGAKSRLLNLKDEDDDLFSYGVDRKGFSSACQPTSRHPIIMTKGEYEEARERGAVDNYVKSGSTEEKKANNYYVCPSIWCPLSRKAYTYQEFKDNNSKCPRSSETPEAYEDKFWTSLEMKRYAGFLNPTKHFPNKKCIPCCFKKKSASLYPVCRYEFIDKEQQEQPPVVEQEQEEIGSSEEPEEPESKQELIDKDKKYIKLASNLQLEKGRSGLIHPELNAFFGVDNCAAGLINKNTNNCILRRGISELNQPFLECISHIIGTDLSTLSKTIMKMSIDKFIGMENGKVMKLFIDDAFDINNDEHFDIFKKWYVNTKNHYVKRFSSRMVEHVKNNLRNTNEILRDFMIFGSYNKFQRYMADSKMVKDHRTLLDFINSDYETLNIDLMNILVIDIEKHPYNLECPFNRNAKTNIHLESPFVFLTKNMTQDNTYHYEVLYQFKQGNEDFKFYYSQKNVKRIVDLYMENCGEETDVENHHANLEFFLEKKGYITQRYVINYNFRVCGLVLKNGLYIPFINEVDIFDVKSNKPIVYISDLKSFKAEIVNPSSTRFAKDVITKIFGYANEFTGTKFYDIESFAERRNGNQLQILNVSLKNGIVIPILKVSEDHEQLDMDVFIKRTSDDERISFTREKNEMEEEFKTFFEDSMRSVNIKYKDELSFLMDHRNPFPINFKRKKIEKILKKVLRKTRHEEQKIYYIEKMNEMIVRHQNMRMYSLRKIFFARDTEVIFEETDMINGRFDEYVSFLKNPYSTLKEKLDDVMLESLKENTQSSTPYLISVLTEFVNNLTGDKVKKSLFSPIFPQLLIYQLDKEGYGPDFVYEIFMIIMKIIHRYDADIIQIKDMIWTHIQFDLDYRQENMELFYENPSFSNSKTDKDSNSIKDLFYSSTYYPSMYEIETLAHTIGIYVIVTRRKLKVNSMKPVSLETTHFMRYIPSSGNTGFYLLFDESFDRELCRDEFMVYMHETSEDVLLKKNDLGPIFWEKIESYYIHNDPETRVKRDHRKLCISEKAAKAAKNAKAEKKSVKT